MTPEQVAVAIAARTPGPWGTPHPGSPGDGMVWDVDGITVGSTFGHASRDLGQAVADARAIVIAVNLADEWQAVVKAASDISEPTYVDDEMVIAHVPYYKLAALRATLEALGKKMETL